MTEPERPDATAIRIERTFAAPAVAVFEAWTSADLLRRWYPPGADWDTPVAEVDLRVGGLLRLVMRSPDGEEFGGGGEYREISPPTRLVFTWAWDRPDVADGVPARRGRLHRAPGRDDHGRDDQPGTGRRAVP